MVATYIFSIILAVFFFYSNVYQFACAKQKGPDYIHIYRSGPALGQMDQFDAIGPHAHGICTLLVLKICSLITHKAFRLILYLNFERIMEDVTGLKVRKM